MDLSKYTAYFRRLKIPNAPGAGQWLAEFSQSLQRKVQNIEQQTNSNADGMPRTPPAINTFAMTNGPSGEIQFSIEDNAPISRGINYSVDLDTSPNFSNPHTFHLGPARNGHINLPGQTFYGRATSWYSPTSPSPYVYHGGEATPATITGGVKGIRSASQGSGTGAKGSGGGPGPVLFRSETSGYDWRLQKATSTPGDVSFQGQGTLAGTGASQTESGGGGGGGGGSTITEAQIAACEALVVGGTANAITGTTGTPLATLSANFLFRLVPTAVNTGAVTLNVDLTGVKAVTQNGAVALSGGELQPGRTYLLYYDGTRYQIIGVSLPISSLVIGTDATGNPILSLLASGNIIVGDGGAPSVAHAVAMSQDGTIDKDGKLTVTGINAAPVPASQGFVGTNGSGQIVAGALPASGVTPGTYVTGLKLTGGGNNGSITIGADGRITAITPAS